MSSRRIQSAYENARVKAQAESRVDPVYIAMYRYLTEDLGLNSEWADERARAEVDRCGAARFCDELEASGIRISGQRILDLGAGLGALTAELASRGGWVVGVEPAEGWRKIARDRLSVVPSAHMLGGVGEFLPIADASIDLIVSLQVLEHVQNPAKVVGELHRVLRPGGCLFMAYENYLGFREPHYRVAWLPLLPKGIGGAYLKLRGRNPQFLLEAVTYTTFPFVRRRLLGAGFVCLRREAWKQKLHSDRLLTWRWQILRSLSNGDHGLALRILTTVDFVKRMFRTFTEETMCKPLT